MEAFQGEFGRRVELLARAWEKWDVHPTWDSTAHARTAASVAVAECLPTMTWLAFERAVVAERRDTRLPVAHCIKLVLKRALANEEFETWPPTTT